MQLFIQTAGINALKTFRKQQGLLDAMLQSVKVLLHKFMHFRLQHGMFKGVALKLFQALMPAAKYIICVNFNE